MSGRRHQRPTSWRSRYGRTVLLFISLKRRSARRSAPSLNLSEKRSDGSCLRQQERKARQFPGFMGMLFLPALSLRGWRQEQKVPSGRPPKRREQSFREFTIRSLFSAGRGFWTIPLKTRISGFCGQRTGIRMPA